MNITVTELLDFLVKATELSISQIDFRKNELNDEEYQIDIYDYLGNNNGSETTIFITKDGCSIFDKGDTIYDLNDLFDEMLEEQNQEKIKEQKRKELLSRLTKEEKELLGLI